MKIKNILYIGAALLLAGCSSEDDLSSTLSGHGKTPLQIEATLSNSNGVTRAANNEFKANDQLLVYLRHVTGSTIGSYSLVTTDQSPRLVTLKVNADATATTSNFTASYTSTSSTTVTGLYWDDFSVGGKGDATDLRTDGHALQSYYGYCYNEGTPTTALNPSAGTLGWTVATDQKTAGAQHSDLLWSPEQVAVTYDHASAANGAHGTLTIPFTHAMSEVTVTITCGEGFVGNPLASTALTLHGMNTVTSFTAPAGTFVNVPGDANANIKDIIMCGADYTSGSTRTFTAIVGPGTKLKVDEKLLDIVNVDGNNYTLDITTSMVPKDNDSDDSNNLAWSKDHAVTEESTKNYILTKPGYNYHLDITLNKTAVTLVATLQDWTTVYATGTGIIQYPHDIVIDVVGETFADKSTFSLFQLEHSNSTDEATERTNSSYNFVTVPAYSTSTSEWTNTPTIYWPDGSTKYYFRALAQFNNDNDDATKDLTSIGTVEPSVATSFAVAQGTDIVWGTTAAHNTHAGDPGDPPTYGYDKGAAIDPRTNDVPIAFEHALSKVTFQLETTNDASVTVNNAKVDLTGATIAVSNLITSGTITLEDGCITLGSNVTAAIAATTAPIENLIVIPQTITNDSKVTITLADGTTYSLQLNECVVTGGSTPITAWERGKHYVYTIHIEKEQITFRALIKEWEKVYGSGNANLEWD